MPVRSDLTADEADLLGIAAPTPEEEAEAEKQSQKAEFERLMLIHLMESQDFRAWLMKVLIGFNTFGRTFAASPTGFPDSSATEFHLGMKAAGWWLWEVFDNAAPELASLMRREAANPNG